MIVTDLEEGGASRKKYDGSDQAAEDGRVKRGGKFLQGASHFSSSWLSNAGVAAALQKTL
jgi:hypothetical protein